jgi:hypothetical protein
MKYVHGFILLVACQTLWAGGYYHNNSIDIYDAASGIYYRSIEKRTEDRGFLGSSGDRVEITNINIYDPVTDTSTLLFSNPPDGTISFVLFESGYRDGTIEFGEETSTTFVRNNTAIKKRAPKDLLLIGVSHSKPEQTILYVSDKRGAHMKKLVAVPDADDWHIDVRNSKLRIVHQTGQGLKIDNYEW